MIFSATSSHALRALAFLAAHAGDEAVLGRDLARALGVPADYLLKVLATLARHGLLTATRGAKGGYRLARAPERIRLIEVVEPFEGKRVRPGCLLRPERPCRSSGACSAHDAWSGLKEAHREFLHGTTLADIQWDAEILPGRAQRRRPATKGARHGPSHREG